MFLWKFYKITLNLKDLHFFKVSDSMVPEPKTCYLTMPIGVGIMHVSHEEIRHDFLLYQAENHTIQIVKLDFEGVKTFTIHPHISDEALASQKQSVCIVPILDYRLNFFPENPEMPKIANNFPSRSVLSCLAPAALETRLASSLRKPPKVIENFSNFQSDKAKPASQDGGFFYFTFLSA